MEFLTTSECRRIPWDRFFANDTKGSHAIDEGPQILTDLLTARATRLQFAR